MLCPYMKSSYGWCDFKNDTCAFRDDITKCPWLRMLGNQIYQICL